MDLWNGASPGLRLVEAMMSQPGGRVEVPSGPGTTFVIRFRER